jgi:hypothetical protein
MTEEKIKVWPKPGLIVRDAARQLYPEDGSEVIATRDVLRRIKDGDLLREDPKAQPAKEHGVTRTPEREDEQLPAGTSKERGTP